MHKIVSQFGLLVFFLSIIFFSQEGLEVIDIFIRSVSVSLVVTLMLTLLALTFVKSVNKKIYEKENSSQILNGGKNE